MLYVYLYSKIYIKIFNFTQQGKIFDKNSYKQIELELNMIIKSDFEVFNVKLFLSIANDCQSFMKSNVFFLYLVLYKH